MGAFPLLFSCKWVESVFSEYSIHVDQLCVGLYVRLEPKKNKRLPFLRKSFKIRDKSEIEKIRKYGLTHVMVILNKSDRMPLDPPETGEEEKAESKQPGLKTPVSKELLGLKKETSERNKRRRKRYALCERKYEATVGQVVAVLRRASGRSNEAVDEAVTVVDSLVDTFLSDKDVLINVMNAKPTESRSHYHALNVTVLSMMLGKELNFKADTMHQLGMGALFHDVGKGRMPISELKRGHPTALKYALQKHYQQHPIKGAAIAADLQSFPKKSLHIIMQHHETVDGKGFPNRLQADRISPLSKIVAVANRYDNLCNTHDPQNALPPHEALKIMFAKNKSAYDQRLLTMFIHNMGVYPPGTLVRLSNGSYGMVVSINPKKSLRPNVMVYHQDIPKREALILDLSLDEDLEIKQAVRHDAMPKEVLAYLNPSSQINYYADSVN